MGKVLDADGRLVDEPKKDEKELDPEGWLE